MNHRRAMASALLAFALAGCESSHPASQPSGTGISATHTVSSAVSGTLPPLAPSGAALGSTLGDFTGTGRSGIDLPAMPATAHGNLRVACLGNGPVTILDHAGAVLLKVEACSPVAAYGVDFSPQRSLTIVCDPTVRWHVGVWSKPAA